MSGGTEDVEYRELEPLQYFDDDITEDEREALASWWASIQKGDADNG